MTLEEAIQHCKNMAKLNEAECFECAEEHEQLAEWLTELKEYLEQKPKQGEWEEIYYDNMPRFWDCSVCKERNTFPSDFCPNCGARMKGGDEK